MEVMLRAKDWGGKTLVLCPEAGRRPAGETEMKPVAVKVQDALRHRATAVSGLWVYLPIRMGEKVLYGVECRISSVTIPVREMVKVQLARPK